MQFSVFLIILGVAVVTHTSQGLKRAKGIAFLGVGYNLLRGNPDGGDSDSGGADRGLYLARKIFELTYDEEKTSSDGLYSVPDEVVFEHRSSCHKNSTKEVVAGVKSYHDKLNLDVAAEGSYDAGLWKAAFSLSSRYQKMKKETSENKKVFFEDKEVCNLGTARYKLDEAKVDNYQITNDFAAALSLLPEEYDEAHYREFIEGWGTSIVTRVIVGYKIITRTESSYTKLISNAMRDIGLSASVSAGYGGASGSLSVDMDKLKESMTDEVTLGENKVTWTSGGNDLPEPIALSLVPINEALHPSFVSKLDKIPPNLDAKRENIIKVLKEYPTLTGAYGSQDPNVTIDITWPLGTYGFPMPQTGCPTGSVVFHEGTRYHDTQDSDPINHWSPSYHLKGIKGADNVEQKFCMKTQPGSTDTSLPWPKGRYCIYKKGDCPEGLGDDAKIYWDDEDDNNKNTKSGELPDGTYGRNTDIYYCCCSDGFASNKINLPIGQPFVLFPYKDNQCQQVKGMKSTKEWFFVDVEDDSPSARVDGPIDAEVLSDKNLMLRYCYYQQN